MPNTEGKQTNSPLSRAKIDGQPIAHNMLQDLQRLNDPLKPVVVSSANVVMASGKIVPVILKEVTTHQFDHGDIAPDNPRRGKVLEATSALSSLIDEGLMLEELNDRPKFYGFMEQEVAGFRTTTLVMERIIGPTLAEAPHAIGRWYTFEETMGIARVLLNTLNKLHAYKGIIHRDLKPENIIMDGLTPVIIDYGIGANPSELKSSTGFTDSERTSGTLGFAPPEQHDSTGNYGPWGDLYSLGVMIFEQLAQTDIVTFIKHNCGTMEYMTYVQNFKALTDMTSELIRKNIPDDFIIWLRGALQPDYRHRYHSAQEMLDKMPQVA